MFKSIASIGAKKTVAGVLSVFHKAIAELEGVEKDQSAEAVRQADNVLQARLAHDQAIAEAAQAREVIGKMQSIILPPVQYGAGSLSVA